MRQSTASTGKTFKMQPSTGDKLISRDFDPQPESGSIQPLTVVIQHKDGSKDIVSLNHTFGKPQMEWFKAGSALKD